MGLRRAVVVSSLLSALAGCDRKAPAPSAVASATPSFAETVPSARRPTRRYFLSHTQARCEVYFADADRISPPSLTPCPPDLRVGERIRIAGKTCVREGNDPERVEPVVCPDPLTNLERRDLAGPHE